MEEKEERPQTNNPTFYLKKLKNKQTNKQTKNAS